MKKKKRSLAFLAKRRALQIKRLENLFELYTIDKEEYNRFRGINLEDIDVNSKNLSQEPFMFKKFEEILPSTDQFLLRTIFNGFFSENKKSVYATEFNKTKNQYPEKSMEEIMTMITTIRTAPTFWEEFKEFFLIKKDKAYSNFLMAKQNFNNFLSQLERDGTVSNIPHLI